MLILHDNLKEESFGGCLRRPVLTLRPRGLTHEGSAVNGCKVLSKCP